MTEDAAAEPFDSLVQQGEAATLGMWVFLATEVLFFGTLFAAFAVGRHLHRDSYLLAGRETDVFYGTLNTAVLLTSSATAAWAAKTGSTGERLRARRWFAATLVLAAAFLVIKGFEYRSDLEKHLFPGPSFRLHAPGAEIFWSLYWIMTGVHALHVTIGIGLFTFIVVRLRDPGFAIRAPRATLEVPVLYWHFVDIVWIFLYPMLYLGGRSQ